MKQTVNSEINSRQYPLYPIPAVSGFVVSQNAVLLVKRNQEPAKDMWAFPGGVIQTGELPEEALKREVFEECNIEIAVRQFLKVQSHVFKDHQDKVKYHYLILTYLCHAKSQSGIANSDISQLKWHACTKPVNDTLAPGIQKILTQYRHLIIGEEASF